MKEDILSQFLISVAGNPKILASHISLFSAILCCKGSDSEVFNVSRNKLMKLSKLKSTATYHKCLIDLVELECIIYEPSYHPRVRSKIILNFE